MPETGCGPREFHRNRGHAHPRPVRPPEASQLSELRRILEEDAQNNNVVLNLEAVRLVDQEVVQFLSDCEATGIRLEKCPGYIREWITRCNATDSSAPARNEPDVANANRGFTR